MKSNPVNSHLAVLPKISHRAFTLIEVLVATVVLMMLLVTVLQILGSTNTTIHSLNRQMDAATQAREALDRFSADFSTAMLSGGASALCMPATSTEASAIGFICRSRARSAGSGNPSWQGNLRGAVVGYRMTEQSFQGVDYKALSRGDGRLTFDQISTSDRAASDLSTVFTALAASISQNSGGDSLVWNSLGAGIMRFHISYQLDNGVITQVPPVYSMISPQNNLATTFLNGANIAPSKAIAFSSLNAPTSGGQTGRYVKALIVGVAAIDRDTLQQSSSMLSQLNSLGTPGIGSSPDTDTPLSLWESNLDKISFPPLRQNIRFYQRTISVP